MAATDVETRIWKLMQNKPVLARLLALSQSDRPVLKQEHGLGLEVGGAAAGELKDLRLESHLLHHLLQPGHWHRKSQINIW